MKIEKIDFHEFIESITNMLEMRDFYTKGHSNRVAEYSELIAVELGMKKEHVEIVHIAGHFHDIGKIGVPDYVLKKEGKLTYEEFEIIKTHSVMGYNVLKNIEGFKIFAKIIKHHHERWDGTGYPDNLKGDTIPMSARIIAVADAFDAMTSNRVYRRSLTIEESIKELLKNRWKQFDGDVVDAFMKVLNKDKIRDIMFENRDYENIFDYSFLDEKEIEN